MRVYCVAGVAVGLGLLPACPAPLCPPQRREDGGHSLLHPRSPEFPRTGRERLAMEGATRANQQGWCRVCR